MVQKTVVRARLRKGKDDDLRAAVETLIKQGHDEADLVRAGLRQLLGLGSRGPLSYNLEAVERHPAVSTAVIEKSEPVKKIKVPLVEKIYDKKKDTTGCIDDDLDRLLGM